LRTRLLLLAAAVAVAVGQAFPAAADDNPRPVDNSRNVFNAPAPVATAQFQTGPSIKQGTAFCSTSTSSAANVNTDCAQSTVGPHNETSIAVNPTNPNNIIGGANDWQQVVTFATKRRDWLQGERAAETLRWYEDVGAAFVCVDGPAGEAPTMLPRLDAVTRDDLAYFRAHGRNLRGWVHGRSVEERFGYSYGEAELDEIAARARGLAATAALVKMHFNNNRGADAPGAARRLREILGQDPGPAAVEVQGRLL